MENPTRFDLNAALQTWQQELAAQSSLTAEVRRELQTHVRDTIAELQKRGLSDEESFWLARRRAGQPSELGEEFLKANPTAVWRGRILWMAMALLAVTLWSGSASIIISHFIQKVRSQPRLWVFTAFSVLLRVLPPFVFAFYLLRGGGQKFSRMGRIFQSRSRFAMTATGWLILNEGFSVVRWLGPEAGGSLIPLWETLISTLSWPLALIALIVWLLPAEESRILKRA